jgi:ATP-dependent RNA helicase DeaD
VEETLSGRHRATQRRDAPVEEFKMSEDTTNPFAALGLSEPLVRTLGDLGYEGPTPIQERTIPILLAGGDLIGQAQTGTGKTAAFALPLLERLDFSGDETLALVLTPTRELAMQVAEAIHSYARGLGHINVLPVYGGAPIGPQLRRLERGTQIVVGTPGRIIDHLDRRSLDLSKVQMIVLDEADEMLKMGFQEDVERILGAAPEERQTALFSATMPDEILRISRKYLRNPQRVEIEHKSMAAPAIEQRFLNLAEGQKLEVLTQLLELESSDAVLIFRRTKNGAAELAERLEARGFAAVALHGDMAQSLRESVIRRVKSGQVEIVVATDVAARGLDLEQITHVINYDIPNDVEAYVHRIGRTGRAGRSGLATLFVTPRERRMMREIEKFSGTPIKPMKLPTRADVAARRIALFKETIRQNLQQGDLDLYLELVEQLSEEGKYDIAEIAAAAARVANGARSLAPEPEPRPVVDERPVRRDEPSRGRAAAGGHQPRERGGYERGGSPGRERDDEGAKVTLSMAVGNRDGIRPADVVGSIANEAGIAGREIGPIQILEDRTIVSIPAEYRDLVIEKLSRAKFRGRSVNLRETNEQPRRESRPPTGARFGGREQAQPRIPYDRGERPQRAFAGGREGAGRFQKRDDRPSRGSERPSRGPARFAPRDSAGAGGERKGFYSGLGRATGRPDRGAGAGRTGGFSRPAGGSSKGGGFKKPGGGFKKKGR